MPHRHGTSKSPTPGLVAAAVASLVGTVLVQCLARLPPLWLDLLLVALAAVAWWRWPRLRWLALVLLALAWTAWRADLALRSRLPKALEKQDFDVIGSVRGLPEPGPIATRFRFDVERAWLDDKPQALTGITRVSWYGAKPGQVAPCTRWHLRLRLKRPRTLANPGGYDSERTALERREVARGYVRAKGRNQALGPPGWCVDRLRAAVSAAITQRVDNAHDARLIRSLAVGDTRGLDEHDWDVARANGISHLLAISGFHVGVAALFGAWFAFALWWACPLLGRYVPRQVAQALAALATAVVYGAMAGFGLPTDRTLVMIAAVALARCSRRSIGGGQALALALLAILAWDPLAVLSAGFWLSFAGVAFLMLGLMRPRNLRGHVLALAATELLMTVTLLPMSVWFFGQASLVGVLSNLLAVPVVSLLVVPLALLGTVMLPLSGWAAGGLWQLAAWIMHALWAVLEMAAQWPGAQWYPPAVATGAMVLATLGALWLFLPRGWPARWLGLLLFVPLLLPPRSLPAQGGFRVWVLDVGQGLSVLVRTRHHAVLYDAGARYPSGFDMGRAVVLPALRALGVHQLDLIMVSHGDNDHAGGAAAVAGAYPRARRWSGEPARVGLHAKQCHSGQHWRFDGVRVEVINPDLVDLGRGPDNDRSCVLLVTGSGGRMLLTGDVSRALEPRLAARVGAGPPLVLLVPHHGSAGSLSVPFLKALQPVFAVNSAGWLNRYHHPAADVVATYRGEGIAFFNTATAGAVEVVFPAAAAPHVQTRWRPYQAPYWRER